MSPDPEPAGSGVRFIRWLSARPTIAAFWLWAALNIVLWAVSLLDGSLHEQMLQSVDYADASGAELAMSRDDGARGFIYLSLAYFAATTLVSALVVHKSAAGKTWAFLLLIPLSLWLGYESASMPVVLGTMYPGTIDLSDWVMGITGGLVWLFILAHTMWRRSALFSTGASRRKETA